MMNIPRRCRHELCCLRLFRPCVMPCRSSILLLLLAVTAITLVAYYCALYDESQRSLFVVYLSEESKKYPLVNSCTIISSLLKGNTKSKSGKSWLGIVPVQVKYLYKYLYVTGSTRYRCTSSRERSSLAKPKKRA